MIGNNFKVRFCLCLAPASQFDSTFGYLPPPLFGHRSRRRGWPRRRWPRRRARGSRQAAGAGSLTRRNSLGTCCLEKKQFPSIHAKFGSTLLVVISWLSRAPSTSCSTWLFAKMQLQVPGSSAARQRLMEVGGISQKQLSAVQFDWYQFRPFTPRTMLPLKATNSTHQQRH